MKKTSKILLTFLSSLLLCSLLFTGCDKIFPQNGDEQNTEPYPSPDYSALDISEYVILGEYKGLTVDTTQYSVTDDVVLWNAIIANAEIIKYPDDALFYYTDQTSRRYAQYAEDGDMTYDELLASLDITQKDIEAEAMRLVKNDLVQMAIIKAENIELTDDEKAKHLDKYIAQYVKIYGYSEEYVKENLIDEIYNSMLYDKMLEFLMINNTVTNEAEE